MDRARGIALRSAPVRAGRARRIAPRASAIIADAPESDTAVLADTADTEIPETVEISKETVTQVFAKQRADPRTVTAIILGGGAGSRLYPLTKIRAKPAVPIGGAYRLIDVPMSNCINSGINKVFILTQFNSASLNRHLARTYNFGNGINFGDGFVE
eukprot:SM003833S14629  [mRNA]  locus=s3833:97:1259:- [translate_table: standard]